MHTGGNGCSDTKRKIILILIKQNIWSKSPIFDDVADFFASCPLPLYIVTNNGMEYVQVAMKDNHLNPAGIICVIQYTVCPLLLSTNCNFAPSFSTG